MEDRNYVKKRPLKVVFNVKVKTTVSILPNINTIKPYFYYMSYMTYQIKHLFCHHKRLENYFKSIFPQINLNPDKWKSQTRMTK